MANGIMTHELTQCTSPIIPTVALLASILEEKLWLQGQLSPHMRRAYKEDIHHFMRTLIVRRQDGLR